MKSSIAQSRTDSLNIARSLGNEHKVEKGDNKMSLDMSAIWHGPYPVRDFVTDHKLFDRFDSPGIYLWTETLPTGQSRLAYVGKAEGRPTLAARQRTHYVLTISGTYSIPTEFIKDREKGWAVNWEDSEVVEILIDCKRYLKIVSCGFDYVAACKVYLWPYRGDVSLKIIERNLLYDLRPTGTTMGTKSVPPQKVSIRHENALWRDEYTKKQIRDDVLFA